MRHRPVADQDPGDEYGQEAGAVDERGRAVDHTGGGDDPQRVERGRGQRHAPHQRQQQRRAGHTDRDAAGHLDDELLDDRPEGAVVARRELDHPDHQRDPDRVVRPGLALQDRPRPAVDLAAAENRERDRWIGRGKRRSEHPARDPGEVEQDVRGERDQRGRGERPQDPEREDRHGRTAEAAPADVEAAFEEDHDQRDDADPLDGDEGDLVADPRHEFGDRRRSDEEERGARDRQPFRDRAAEQRQRDPAGDDEDDHAEVWDLRHRVNLGVCEVAAAAYTFLT